jgi:hypothetical protein
MMDQMSQHPHINDRRDIPGLLVGRSDIGQFALYFVLACEMDGRLRIERWSLGMKL